MNEFCDAEAISVALSDIHLANESHAACPILKGEEHDDEQDCECSQMLAANADYLRTVPEMNCNVGSEEEPEHIMHVMDWAFEKSAKCQEPTNDFCDAEAISAALSDTHLANEAHAACPTLKGEQHDDEQDCECSQMIAANADYLRTVPEMNCNVGSEEEPEHIMHLMDWAFEKSAKCQGPPSDFCDAEAISAALSDTHLANEAHA